MKRLIHIFLLFFSIVRSGYGQTEFNSQKIPFGNGFQLVNIKSTADTSTQKAFFYRSKSATPKPLIISLHTWSGNYAQNDTLSEICKANNINYIHPDFRGPNKTPNACCSDIAIRDMDDAIAYAIANAHVDTSKLYVVGVSGGGYATLAMYMRSAYPIRKFSAWASISDLSAWYHESRERRNEYADMILLCTGSQNGLNETNAKRRSPLYWKLPANRAVSSSLYIYEGVNDGITGSVPITQSINFYNKILAEMKVSDSSKYVSAEETRKLLETRKPLGHYGKIANREICLQKQYKGIHITIFIGGHEILPVYAFNELLKTNNL